MVTMGSPKNVIVLMPMMVAIMVAMVVPVVVPMVMPMMVSVVLAIIMSMMMSVVMAMVRMMGSCPVMSIGSPLVLSPEDVVGPVSVVVSMCPPFGSAFSCFVFLMVVFVVVVFVVVAFGVKDMVSIICYDEDHLSMRE